MSIFHDIVSRFTTHPVSRPRSTSSTSQAPSSAWIRMKGTRTPCSGTASTSTSIRVAGWPLPATVAWPPTRYDAWVRWRPGGPCAVRPLARRGIGRRGRARRRPCEERSRVCCRGRQWGRRRCRSMRPLPRGRGGWRRRGRLPRPGRVPATRAGRVAGRPWGTRWFPYRWPARAGGATRRFAFAGQRSALFHSAPHRGGDPSLAAHLPVRMTSLSNCYSSSSAVVNASAPSASLSTLTPPPGTTPPSSSAIASGSCTRRCTARLSGRAPYAGS